MDSELPNPTFIYILKIYMYFVFAATTVILILFGYIIHICINNQIKIFRHLMLGHIFCCFCVTFVFLLWQPLRLNSSNTIFPSGLLAPMSPTLSAICFALIFILYSWLGDTFYFTFTERHFQVIKFGNSKVKLKRRIVNCFMLFTNFLLMLSSTAFFVTSNGGDANHGIQQSDAIANPQLSLTSYDLFRNRWGWGMMASFFMYLSYRVILMLWILFESFSYGRNSQITQSQNSWRKFQLMRQTTIIQAVTNACFLTPCVLMVLLMIWPWEALPKIDGGLNLQLICAILMAFTLLYPMCFCVVALAAIKTYKNATRRIFERLFCKKNLAMVSSVFQ